MGQVVAGAKRTEPDVRDGHPQRDARQLQRRRAVRCDGRSGGARTVNGPRWGRYCGRRWGIDEASLSYHTAHVLPSQSKVCGSSEGSVGQSKGAIGHRERKRADATGLKTLSRIWSARRRLVTGALRQRRVPGTYSCSGDRSHSSLDSITFMSSQPRPNWW